MSQTTSNSGLYNAPMPQRPQNAPMQPAPQTPTGGVTPQMGRAMPQGAVPPQPSGGGGGNTLLYVIVALLAVLLLVGVVAAFLLWGKSRGAASPAEEPNARFAAVVTDTVVVQERETLIVAEPSNATGDALETTLLRRIEAWDRMHHPGGEEEVFGLYASKSDFYTRTCTRNEVADILRDLFAKSPDYKQVSHDVRFSKIKADVMRCDFTKSTVSNGVSRDYPSYLEFTLVGDQWLITCESDGVTDHNIRKR